MKYIYVQFAIIAVMSIVPPNFSAFAVETHLLKGRVSDIAGRPVEGAKLFLYNSSNVRRPADFISSVSDRTGRSQMALPSGKYWVVARFKSDGKYGPLMPGDRHSGEPIEVDMTVGGAEADFVVADIRELGQKKRAGAADSVRIKGRVFDAKGEPVTKVFVYAGRSKGFSELPDFISAWTGADGRYEIYLPPDSVYYVGAARQFPMRNREEPVKILVIEPGKIDIAIDIDLTVQ